MLEQVHDAARLKELQSLILEQKIAITQARIIEWYNAYEGKVYISLSGGKDSTVLLHLVRSLFPDVPAVFSNTGLEYPEIQKFARSFDNVSVVTPKMNFVNVIRTYGYPLISKEVANAIYYARRIRPYNISNDKSTTIWGGGNNSQKTERTPRITNRLTGGGQTRVEREPMEETRITRYSTRKQTRILEQHLESPPITKEQSNSKQGRNKKQTPREFSEGSTSWDSG